MMYLAEEEKTERKCEKERTRKRFHKYLGSHRVDPVAIENEMKIRYAIALRMMMDNVPDEKIRYYALLSCTQIEHIRIDLLPEAIKDAECKNRAMNESLRRSGMVIRHK